MNNTITIIAASCIIFLLVRNSIVARKRNARVNRFMENMNNLDKKKQMKDLNDLIHGKKPSLLSNQEFAMNESGHFERLDTDQIPPQKNPNYRPKTREHA